MILHVLNMAFDMVSECTMTMLILMMTNGWMTKYSKIDMDDGIEIYLPVFFICVMVHICLGAFTYLEPDAHHKYTDFEGPVGYCLIAIKLGFCAAQYYYYSHAKKDIKRRSREFYMKVVAIGLVNLMSDPGLMIVSYLMEPWNRAFYYRLLDQGIHVTVQVFMFYQMKK